MTADLGSLWGYAGPCTLPLSGHKICYLCSLIPHHLPETHFTSLPYMLSPIGSLGGHVRVHYHSLLLVSLPCDVRILHLNLFPYHSLLLVFRGSRRCIEVSSCDSVCSLVYEKHVRVMSISSVTPKE
jgi:hypothetical protein